MYVAFVVRSKMLSQQGLQRALNVFFFKKAIYMIIGPNVTCVPMFFRECQLQSDCGSWSGPSGQPGPRQRSARWSRKSVPPSARPLERKTTHTGAETLQSFCICTCWDTRLILARYVWVESEPEAIRVVASRDPGASFPAGVPEVDRLSEVYWQTDRLFGSHAAAGWEAGCPPTNDKLH